MQSRKHDSITDEDVACLLDASGGDLTDQERLAVTFMDLLSADHHAIDADFYVSSPRCSPPRRSSSSGSASAESMGLHRFIHTLEVFGTGEPVIALLARPGRHPSSRLQFRRRVGLTGTEYGFDLVCGPDGTVLVAKPDRELARVVLEGSIGDELLHELARALTSRTPEHEPGVHLRGSVGVPDLVEQQRYGQ